MSARAEAAMRGGLLPRASEELEEKEQEFASRQRKEGERPLQLAQGAKLRLSDASPSKLWAAAKAQRARQLATQA